MKSLPLIFFLFPYFLFAQFVPGETYFGKNEYIEYTAGNLPFIFAAPHGGGLKPNSIPDRDCDGCSYLRDSYTQELAREILDAFERETGCIPHVIINRLHRVKLDANRDIGDAADGNPEAEIAWTEFHEFIDSAKAAVNRNHYSGLFFDLHGHSHTKQRIELGYLLTAGNLRMSDAELNADSDFLNKTSIVHLVENGFFAGNLAEAVRGEESFGSVLENLGFSAVPSANDPFPLTGDDFFSGGYNTRRHGSRDGGEISAIQIESNRDIRFDEPTRKRYAEALTTAVERLYGNFIADWGIHGCDIGNVPVKNLFDADFKIYPNPASDFIQIGSDEFPLKIQITNALGIPVSEVSVFHESEKISLEDLTPGVYFLKFFNENSQSGVSKLLISGR